MQYEGVLRKMQTNLNSSVQYFLSFDNDIINLNQVIGKTMTFRFLKYECMSCHKDLEIYRQGFCKSCFFETPQAGEWVMFPEKSKAHLGIADRDLEYEKKVQLQPHIVYLSLSSNVKVGVTRKQQIPTRWIDQGAVKAIPILEVPNRYLAGITEVALKDFVADKTNWRAMLKNEVPAANLIEFREELKAHLPEEVKQYYTGVQSEISIEYPVIQYPTKLKSLNLSKTPEYSGKLSGIKGQYLIFDDNAVLNVRNNEGIVVKLTIN